MVELDDLTNEYEDNHFGYSVNESSIHRYCKLCKIHQPTFEMNDINNDKYNKLILCDNIDGWLLHYQEAHEFELAVLEAAEEAEPKV